MKPEDTAGGNVDIVVLQRARAGLGPDEDQRRRTLERLSSALSSHPIPLPQVQMRVPSPKATAAGVVGHSTPMMLVGATASLLLGLGGGYFLGRHAAAEVTLRLSEQPSLSVVRADKSAASEAGEPAGPAVAMVEEAEVRPSDPANFPEQAPLTRKDGAQIPGQGQAKEADPTFYGELSYLQRAQGALRDGNGALALGLMEELDQRPNKGALWAERNVTRTLALCLLGRTTEARRVAAQVLQRESGRAYRKRLEASCATSNE